MSDRMSEIFDSIKDVEGVIGVAVYSKFGDMKYSTLPSWINLKSLIELINSLLRASNAVSKELRRGDLMRTMIETKDGNILISIYGDDVLLFITEKDFVIRLLDKLQETKVLDFKIEKKN